MVHRTLVFGDLDSEPLRSRTLSAGFTEQKHGMDDPLYTLKDKP